jgi:hypothetical protein
MSRYCGMSVSGLAAHVSQPLDVGRFGAHFAGLQPAPGGRNTPCSDVHPQSVVTSGITVVGVTRLEPASDSENPARYPDPRSARSRWMIASSWTRDIGCRHGRAELLIPGRSLNAPAQPEPAIDWETLNRLDVVVAAEPPRTRPPLKDAPRDGDAGPVEVAVVVDGCAGEEGHACGGGVAGEAGHGAVDACGG